MHSEPLYKQNFGSVDEKAEYIVNTTQRFIREIFDTGFDFYFGIAEEDKGKRCVFWEQNTLYFNSSHIHPDRDKHKDFDIAARKIGRRFIQQVLRRGNDLPRTRQAEAIEIACQEIFTIMAQENHIQNRRTWNTCIEYRKKLPQMWPGIETASIYEKTVQPFVNETLLFNEYNTDTLKWIFQKMCSTYKFENPKQTVGYVWLQAFSRLTRDRATFQGFSTTMREYLEELRENSQKERSNIQYLIGQAGIIGEIERIWRHALEQIHRPPTAEEPLPLGPTAGDRREYSRYQ